MKEIETLIYDTIFIQCVTFLLIAIILLIMIIVTSI